jgi:hypothetical protein
MEYRADFEILINGVKLSGTSGLSFKSFYDMVQELFRVDGNGK